MSVLEKAETENMGEAEGRKGIQGFWAGDDQAGIVMIGILFDGIGTAVGAERRELRIELCLIESCGIVV